jgi:hypothetical protein
MNPVLLAMTRNPNGDWRISDIEKLCRVYDIR